MSSPFTLTMDWLSFTLPSGSVKETMEILEGEWTKSQAGFRGYPLSWITVAADRGVGKLGTGAPRSPLEVHVDLSAGIVSAWPTSKVRTVLQWILSHDGHLTRLDCALDDRVSTVLLKTIKAAIEAGQCVTRADQMHTIASSSIHKGTPSGETLYLGSPHSQTLLRIYDKRAELQAKERNDWEAYGIRWELQLKQERAQVCGQVLAYLEETDWLEFIIGVLRSYVDFRHTSREEGDEDRYRAPLLGWWQELTDGFRKGRLVIEKDEQSLPKVKRWVKQSVAPMLAVICAQHPDGQAWLEKQIVAAVSRWKAKHRALVKPASTGKTHIDRRRQL
ncbi:MAG TPA: replication initiation factor domain-containing protein, partial [Nitrospira sp.]|nr:replication initiation factor domain-containing protein [Nitrospira sp.]